MPGLFGGIDDDTKLGLLTAALAAMSARGVRPGTALAQGGLLGINAMQQAKAGRADEERRRREDEFRQMQMEDYRRKLADAERMKQGYGSALNAAINPGSPGGMGAVDMGMDAGVQPPTPASFDLQKYALALRDVDPAKAAELLIPKAQKSPWSEINPKDYTQASLRVFARTKDPADLVARDDTKPVSRWQDIPAPPGGAGQQWQRNQDTGEIRAVGSRAPVTNITTNNYPDLPKDHMWTDPRDPRKGVTPIPGSETERALAARKAAEQASGNIVLTNIDRARSMVKSSPVPMTGLVGSQVARVPGTPQYNLSQIIAPIKANIRLDALTQMRSLSKTGAALGNVTEKEGEVMERKVASLEQAQTDEQFLQALDDVEREYNRIVNGISSAPATPAGDKRIRYDKNGRRIQ